MDGVGGQPHDLPHPAISWGAPSHLPAVCPTPPEGLGSEHWPWAGRGTGHRLSLRFARDVCFPGAFADESGGAGAPGQPEGPADCGADRTGGHEPVRAAAEHGSSRRAAAGPPTRTSAQLPWTRVPPDVAVHCPAGSERGAQCTEFKVESDPRGACRGSQPGVPEVSPPPLPPPAGT